MIRILYTSIVKSLAHRSCQDSYTQKGKIAMTKKEIKEKISAMDGQQARIALLCINEGKAMEEAIEIALTY